MLRFTVLAFESRDKGWRRLRLEQLDPDAIEPVNGLPVEFVGARYAAEEPWLLPLLDWLGYTRLPEMEAQHVANNADLKVCCYARPLAWPELSSGERELAAGLVVEDCDAAGHATIRVRAGRGARAERP